MAEKRISDLTLRSNFDATCQIPTDDSSQSWRVTGAQMLTFFKENAMPSGSVLMHGGSATPSGYLACDGTAVSRSTYADLFTAIGTAYGVGDGSTTFNVPDFRNVFPRGANSSTRTINTIVHPIVARGTTYDDQMQGHRHSVSKLNSSGGTGSRFDEAATNNVATNTNNVSVAGTNLQAMNPITDATNGTPRTGLTTFPVNLGINFIIKT